VASQWRLRRDLRIHILHSAKTVSCPLPPSPPPPPPRSRCFFLSYLCVGSLRQQVLYPHDETALQSSSALDAQLLEIFKVAACLMRSPCNSCIALFDCILRNCFMARR
jgi:hypothetical protein